MRYYKKLVPLCITALMLSGCGTQPNPNVELLFEIPNSLSEYQRKIVADGIVTKSEYRQAVTDWAACVRAEGVDADESPIENEWGRISFGFDTYVGGMSEAEQDKLLKEQERIYDECGMEYAKFVEGYYLTQEKPKGAERDRRLAEMVSCFQDLDIDFITVSDDSEEVIIKKLTEAGYAGDNGREVFDCLASNRLLFYNWSPVGY